MVLDCGHCLPLLKLEDAVIDLELVDIGPDVFAALFLHLVDLSLHEFLLPLLLHQVAVARLIRLDKDSPLSSHLLYVFREQFR